ncbi:MAG: SpoIVB peptidase [Clostridia bacterium]|nr:SpoIVB peptidase [Clostridia bacterium]
MRQKKIFFLIVLFAFFAIYITSIYTNYDVYVSAVPNILVIPAGNAVGVKIYSEGVLVIGSSVVEGVDGGSYEPCKNTKIRAGDVLLKINNRSVEDITELVEAVNSAAGQEVEVTYKREEKIYTDTVRPVKSLDDGNYKLGLWVRDGTTGIGTLTFYAPELKSYGALGHGISDIDVKTLLPLEEGTLNEASVLSITKGAKSAPGEIRGIINSSYTLGNVLKNNEFGIYGRLLNESYFSPDKEAIPVASRMEVRPGKATILCTVEGSIPKEYEIEIQKIYNLSGKSTKSMIVKITDAELLSKTGGIVQGMSGSPIIQNGKFVGAITHVFVNDPTRGYAVFADTMIEQIM